VFLLCGGWVTWRCDNAIRVCGSNFCLFPLRVEHHMILNIIVAVSHTLDIVHTPWNSENVISRPLLTTRRALDIAWAVNSLWSRARIIWSRHTISSRASHYDSIIARHWHNDIVVLRYRDKQINYIIILPLQSRPRTNQEYDTEWGREGGVLGKGITGANWLIHRVAAAEIRCARSLWPLVTLEVRE